jgi:quinol monooxygenase YgiN
MSSHVLVISEWLSKKNHEQELFESFKNLASLTLEKEKGCIKYNVTRPIDHPAAKGESKYTILLIQEYENIDAFDNHCKSEHVAEFVKKHVGDESIIVDWRCRIFSEE